MVTPDTVEQAGGERAWDLRLTGVGYSYIGKKRFTNQDRFYVNNMNQIFVVADGVGGLQFGERASEAAITCLKATLDFNPAIKMDVMFQMMHQAVRITGIQLTGNGSSIGTTLTCLRNRGDCCEIGHIGDSKLYWLDKEGIFDLSEDHSVRYRPRTVRIVSASSNPPELPPERTYLKRYLGQNGPLKPFVVNFRPAPSDFILLCSDGISGTIATAELQAIIKASESKARAIQAFIASAETRGGRDNQTAVLVSCA